MIWQEISHPIRTGHDIQGPLNTRNSAMSGKLRMRKDGSAVMNTSRADFSKKSTDPMGAGSSMNMIRPEKWFPFRTSAGADGISLMMSLEE